MRRTLDPEGYEDPGLKSSHLSLGEMSSEWLLGDVGSAGTRAGIAWAPASGVPTLRVWQSRGLLCHPGTLLRV